VYYLHISYGVLPLLEFEGGTGAAPIPRSRRSGGVFLIGRTAANGKKVKV
jgi:hypothetical protein